VERNNFYYLFAGLVFVLAIEPWLTIREESGAAIQLAFTAILVSGVWSLRRERPAVFRTALALAAVGLLTAGGYLATEWEPLRIVDLLAIVVFCALTIGVTLDDVVIRPADMGFNRVVGALCIFLLFGVMWAILFAFVEFVDPSAFHYAGPHAADPVEHFLYYSFVTLTTLGYGDITPINPVARTLAYMEAVTGQLYLAVLVAGLVGRHVAGLAGSRADA
jgi:hypothetical protein